MSLRSRSLRALPFAVALLLAACTSETGTVRDAAASATAATAATAPVAGHPEASSGDGAAAAASRSTRPVAALAAYPDRGDLVGYDHVRRVQRQGAHAFHAVRVSEAHALAAIGTGTLHFTAPDGSLIALRYERHVEHANGDWSWIGRDADGIDGILTFGEKAVFGVLPHGDNAPLRLTTLAGQAWVATTAKGVQSPLQQRINAGAVGPDYKLPPPGLAGARATAAGGEARAAAEAVAAVGPAATTTIDVLLGYTAGFASMMGGTSQAQTRLNHLVTVGNQAFANSSVDVSLRLVGTLQVAYPDTGSNDTAVDQLTGSNGSSSVPVPASLQPLRAARETLGADLVSLVRRFRDPEHGGCGMAWLIGGGQTTIVPGHERFGYSVISDSNGMQAPDNGHYCRDETLVHELGHNLGSQHDEAAARDDNASLAPSDYGRYPYSFGYKTDSAGGNFFTVMAYGDRGQAQYRIFSNPQSTYCGGRPCGVVNRADNARSLRQTAPLIAAFRAAVATAPRVRSDFNGDGRSDLFWRRSSNGRNAIWLSADNRTQQAIAGVVDAWKPVGVGDFDGDGRADIAWRHPSSGRNVIWRGGNAGDTIAIAGVGNASWTVAGVGDFNGDGRDDLLWRDGGSGRNAIWLSANAATQQPVATVADTAWRVAGVADLDGDGRDDIVWRHASTGQNALWPAGAAGSSRALSTVPLGWAILAVDDFDGDGRADIFWRQAGSGRNALWRSGNSATQIGVPGVGGAWTVVASGDYDGDGMADLAWRNMSSGRNIVWRRADAGDTITLATVSDMGWQVVR